MKKYFTFILILISIFLHSDIIDNNIENYLVQSINNAQSNIVIFNNILSSQKILNSIINAKNNNINVFISLNNSYFNKAYSLHEQLINNNINLHTHYWDLNLMIIDDSIVYLGNYLLSKDKYQKHPIIIKSINNSLAKQLKEIMNKTDKYIFNNDTINYKQLTNNPEKFINRNLIVKCKIKEIKKSHKNNTYILYTSKNKNDFKIVIFPDLYKKFEKENINIMYFLNKEIIVKGYFFKHKKYGYEIILKSTKDIVWK